MQSRLQDIAWIVPAIAVGCSAPMAIPSSAEDVKSGVGKLSFTAPENGEVFLQDSVTRTRIFSGKIQSGEQIVVDPALNRIALSGQPAEHSPALREDHRYRIYFDLGR